MKRIQDLIDQGIITNFTVGKSGLAEKGLFCSIRVNTLEGYVQGSGPTVEAALADTLRRIPGAPQTRPVTTTFQMPEVPILRMPF